MLNIVEEAVEPIRRGVDDAVAMDVKVDVVRGDDDRVGKAIVISQRGRESYRNGRVVGRLEQRGALK